MRSSIGQAATRTVSTPRGGTAPIRRKLFKRGEGKTSVGRINKEANVKTGAVLRGKTNTVAAAPFISG